MATLSLEEAVNCLLAIDQIRLKSALAYLNVENEATVNLLIEGYQTYLDIGGWSISISATPDCDAQSLYELILEKYQIILPKKHKIAVPSSINKTRRTCWETVDLWRKWRFQEISDKAGVKAPLLLIKQAEYLKVSAVQELRDLSSRLSVSVLLVSDRPLKKIVEAAEGRQRFFTLDYPLLLLEGLQRLKREIESNQLQSYEEYLLFFENIKNRNLLENVLKLGK